MVLKQINFFPSTSKVLCIVIAVLKSSIQSTVQQPITIQVLPPDIDSLPDEVKTVPSISPPSLLLKSSIQSTVKQPSTVPMLPSDSDSLSDKAQKRSSVSPPSQSGKSILSTSINSSINSKLPVNDISSGDIAPVAGKKGIAVCTQKNVQTASTNKTLQCKFCNQQYLHKSSLSRHIRTVHNEEKGRIECELCSER